MRTLSQKKTGRQSVPQKTRKCTSPEVGPWHQACWRWAENGEEAGPGHTLSRCVDEPLACISEPRGPTCTKLTALWFLPLPPSRHFPTASKAYLAILRGTPPTHTHTAAASYVDQQQVSWRNQKRSCRKPHRLLQQEPITLRPCS